MSFNTLSTKSKSRFAVSFGFFTNGIIYGGWVAHIPTIQSKFSLSEAFIGTLILVVGIGAVVMMGFTAWLVNRFGSRRLSIISCLSFAFAFPVLFLAPNVFWLIPVAFIFGAANGSLDVAVNGQAVMVEQDYGRPIMSSFHGIFSLGGLIGAGLAALILNAGGTALQQACGTLVVLVLLSFVFFPHLTKRQLQKQSDEKKSSFILNGSLIFLGCITFIIFMTDGGVANWSALYLRDYVSVDAAQAALGYAAFASATTIGRLTGDIFVRRLGNTKVLMIGGLFISLGMSLVLIPQTFTISLIGFALTGIGLANLIPIAFSRSGNLPGVSPSTGIAVISVCGYSGFLLGPPIIGSLAQIYNLPTALSLLILFGVIMLLSAKKLFSDK